MIPGKQEPPSATITPVAGFVIKARLTGGQAKLFINIVGHNLVEAPHTKTLLDASNQHALRIPLSVAEPLLVKDNSGADCEAVDVMINDRVLKDTDTDAELKQMVIEIALQAVANKYKLQIDEKSVTLPKLKYKGEQIRQHRIRIKKEASIEEVFNPNEEPPSSQPPQQRQPEPAKRRLPHFNITYTREDGDTLDGLLLPCYRSVTDIMAANLKTKVFGEAGNLADRDMDELLLGRVCHIDILLPELVSKRSVQLAINDDCIHVQFTGVSAAYEAFTIWFPTDLLSEKAEAVWEDKTLKVRVPVN